MARFTLRTPSWRVAVVALAALAIGCGASSAGTAPAGASGAPTVPATASANASQGGASTMSLEPSAAPSGSFASPTPSGRFALTSPAFDDGGSIPRESTCDGPDRSPELRWSGAPPGTAAFALEVVDPDARDFVHWLVVDLAGAPAGRVPANVGTGPGAPQQGRNGFGRIGWGGPCPPSGTHHYVFTLIALGAPLGLSSPPDRTTLDAAIAGHTVLGKARLTGTYRRG